MAGEPGSKIVSAISFKYDKESEELSLISRRGATFAGVAGAAANSSELPVTVGGTLSFTDDSEKLGAQAPGGINTNEAIYAHRCGEINGSPTSAVKYPCPADPTGNYSNQGLLIGQKLVDGNNVKFLLN